MRGQLLTPLIVPLLVQRFVGETHKGAYVGTIRLWGLMVALLVQSLMGMLSDQSRSKWGRRRPFIFTGAIGEMVTLLLIGFTAGFQGLTGYWVLLGLYVVSMVFANTSQAATQGLIPDLAPEDERGKFSAVKALMELPFPLIFLAVVVGELIGAGNFWGAIGLVILTLLVCMAVTMFVPEKQNREKGFPMKREPFFRLVLMTALFTTIILVLGKISEILMQQRILLSVLPTRLLIGLIGVFGIGIAIVFGVWISVRIGAGKEGLSFPGFKWWIMNRLAFLVAITNLGVFMLFFLQERYTELQGEKAASLAARVIMFVGISILLSALPAGWLSDRIGKKTVVGLSGAMAAFGTFIIIQFPQMGAVYVGACMIGASTGFFYTSNWALGTEIVPKAQAGRFLGISNLAGAGAGAVGAYIGGPLADQGGYVLLFSVFGIIFLLSVLTLFGIPGLSTDAIKAQRS